MTALATTLQAFFTDRMARQRQVSPNTLAAYRDALRLLLVFAADKKGKEPSKLDIDDLDAPLISAFLDDLEHQRKNGARTRNLGLPRFAHCSDTPPFAIPIVPLSSRAFSPSLPSASTEGS
jgi:site-specific recombinase XerC